MTTENQEEFKTFLSLKKTSVYLSIVLVAFIFILLDWAGNSFILLGLGLFLGHNCYRAIKYKGQVVLKVISLIITISLIIFTVVLKYNSIRAITLIVFFTLVSILIDWKRNNFVVQKIMIFVLLLLPVSLILYYSDNIAESLNNNSTEKDLPKEHVLIHHTRPSIKNEFCIQVFDSAISYMEINDFIIARKLLHKCNDIEPNNATIINSLGVSYFSNGDTATALKYYLKAIETDSTKPEAYASAGCVLDMLNRQNEAIKILKIGYSKTNLDHFTHYNICSNLSIAYFHIDSCNQAKKFIAIAKRHGFNNPQFDKHIQQVEKGILDYCK